MFALANISNRQITHAAATNVFTASATQQVVGQRVKPTGFPALPYTWVAGEPKWFSVKAAQGGIVNRAAFLVLHPTAKV
jgi:hypothetical protein